MSNSINAKDITKLMDSTPEELKKGIKDIDLRTIDKDIIQEIVKKINVRSIRDLEKNIEQIYILITNPKGGIDINSKIFNNYIIEWFTFSNNIEKFKHLIENYHPKFNAMTSHGKPLGIKLLYYCIENDTDKVAELLLGYITINKHDGLMKQLYDSDFDATKFYKLFVRHGLSIDEVIDKNSGGTSLIKSIQQSRKKKFDFFLEQDADVNYLTKDNYTPLKIAIYINNGANYAKKLLERGADVHFISSKITMEDNKVFENISLLQEVIYDEINIEIVKLLLEYGADKNHKETTTNRTALDIAKDKYDSNKKYYKEVITLLGGELPEKTSDELWKGFSRSDIEKFDIFFEKPFDWSCCPICLEYVERSDGCMYMSHNCATTGHYYHEKLYDAYVYDTYGKKQIEWCTVCGRITEFHKHFILTDANNPSNTKAQLKPEIQAQLDRGDNFAFFDNANCIGFGGGGTEEKAARFRRLREYALELQEDVGKKDYENVMEELIEEVWNAPLVRNKKIKKILADKRWNINVTEFPENKRNTRNNNNSNAANQPFNGRKPTVKESEDCIIYADDEEGEASNPTYQFHHETVGGLDHDGIYICQKDLAKAVEIKCKEFGLEDFGKCWFSQCKGILHPEELKGIIPEVIYNEYRKKFNKKMVKKGGKRTTRKTKKQKGGNVKSVLHELTDGTCTPPNLTRNGKLRK